MKLHIIMLTIFLLSFFSPSSLYLHHDLNGKEKNNDFSSVNKVNNQSINANKRKLAKISTVDAFDTTPPVISSIKNYPATPTVNDNVTIIANISDPSGVSTAILMYRINGSNWINQTMTNLNKTLYEGVIPHQKLNALVEYSIKANDSLNNIAELGQIENGGFEKGRLSPWTTLDNYTAIIDNTTADAYSGNYSLKLYSNSIDYTYAPSIEQTLQIPVPNEFINDLEFYVQTNVIDAALSIKLTFKDNSTFTKNWDSYYYSYTKLTVTNAELPKNHILTKIQLSRTDVRFSPVSSLIDGFALSLKTKYTVKASEAPQIISITHNPIQPNNSSNITITANVLDDYGLIDTVLLYYQINVQGWKTEIMNGTYPKYQATISNQTIGTEINYYIVVNDIENNVNRSSTLLNGGFEAGFNGDYWSSNNTGFFQAPAFCIRTGSYCAALTDQYAYFEQTINVPVATMDELSFDLISPTTGIKLTISYTDNTFQQFTFGPNGTWQTYSVYNNQLRADKTIGKIRFEYNGTFNVNEAGFDNIVLSKYTVMNSSIPTINLVNRSIQNPMPGNSVTIKANASDLSGIQSCNLTYSINSSAFTTISMTLDANNLYSVSIPAQTNNINVVYQIIVTNILNLTSKSGFYGYLVKDNQSPTIALKTLNNNSILISGTIISLNITDSSGLNQVLYKWDSGLNTSLTTPYNVLLPNIDKEHVLMVYAEDTYQNWNQKVFTFMTDDYSPAINLLNLSNGSFIPPNSNIKLNVTDSNGISQVLINWDKAVANTTLFAPYDLVAPSTNGQHSITVFADDIGEKWTKDEFIFNISSELPIISLFSSVNNSILSSISSIKLNITASIGLNQTLYDWDSGVNISLSNSYTISIPVIEGYHALYIFAQANNSLWSFKRYIFTTDNTAPDVNLDSLINDSALTSGSIIHLNITDNFNISQVTAIWNSGTTIVLHSPYTITAPDTKGTYSLIIMANDMAGNTKTIVYVFTVNPNNQIITSTTTSSSASNLNTQTTSSSTNKTGDNSGTTTNTSTKKSSLDFPSGFLLLLSLAFIFVLRKKRK